MELKPFNLKIQKRDYVSNIRQTVAVVIALFCALLVASILIRLAGGDIFVAMKALFTGAFGGWREITETLVRATPLMLTGLAITVAFRAKIWNIGAEGQLFSGAIGAYFVVSYLGTDFTVLNIALIIAVSMLAGGLWGALAGFLKAKYGVNEIIVTVMLNYITIYGMSFLLTGPWRDPSSFYTQSSRLPEVFRYPLLFSGTRVHLGFLLAIIVAVIVYVILWKTPFGYEIRFLGSNVKAARYKGINISRTVISIMFLSGAIAGLAGAGELAGLHFRLRADISKEFGFVGIIVALLARLNPFAVIMVAILLGGLGSGATRMQIATGIPVALVNAIQGIIFLFLIISDVVCRYKIRGADHAN